MSATCDTEIPLATPKYKTFEPGRIKTSSIPPMIATASLLLNGFHTWYSTVEKPVTRSEEDGFCLDVEIASLCRPRFQGKDFS